MVYQHLSVERDGPLAVVRLNRPECANALSYQHLLDIEQCALDFREDADTRVVIFAANGKHFSAGADLNEMLNAGDEPMVLKRRHQRMGERALRALLGMDQITICAWHGGALGGGACLTTALDFRIGADDCFMQYPEIELGLNLMWQSLPLTTRLVGAARAKRLVIGGERIHAEMLLNWGVLDELVKGEELIEQARVFAQTYIYKSPIAAQMIKRSINHICGALDEALMHMDADQNLFTQTTEDQVIAAEAYLNKKAPQFKGN